MGAEELATCSPARKSRPYRVSALAACLALVFGASATAEPIGILFETDADASAGSEVALASFASIDDIINYSPLNTRFSDVNVSSTFSTTGIAYDGNIYHLMFETDSDASAGSELAFASFASIEDIVTYTPLQTRFSDVNVSSTFSTTGLAFDGDFFHLMFETDADASAGSELAFARFASIEDIINYNPLETRFSDVNVSSTFSTTGLSYDGELYHLMFETDTDASAGSEVAMASFASINDIINYNPLETRFSDVNVSSTFSTTGLYSTVDFDTEPEPPNGVPEPGALVLIGLGVGGLAFLRRRRRTESPRLR